MLRNIAVYVTSWSGNILKTYSSDELENFKPYMLKANDQCYMMKLHTVSEKFLWNFRHLEEFHDYRTCHSYDSNAAEQFKKASLIQFCGSCKWYPLYVTSCEIQAWTLPLIFHWSIIKFLVVSSPFVQHTQTDLYPSLRGLFDPFALILSIPAFISRFLSLERPVSRLISLCKSVYW